ncbi:MAG: M20/M25/M40 family metallo-hydrolase [Cyanobacteria bacterium]|nr:M20/M25/M40 family metallo-hydrolase [Cyanobacteriota bacterium]
MVGVKERFKAIVVIDNPSGGEAQIRDYIRGQLQELGLHNQKVDDAGNLLVSVPGDSSLETILLSAHMDSVPPCHGIIPIEDVQESRPIIRSQGKTILGADDKSGIALIISLMEQLSAEGFKQNHPLELLFSTGEEVGLIGAKAFDMSQLKASYGYVLDGEGSVGDIFNAGPSQENLLFHFEGKRAHAGIAPEEGINAIELSASFCASVPSGRITETLTSNFGWVQGGDAMNIVAPSLTLKGEARSHSEEELSGLLTTYQNACDALVEKFPGASIEFVKTRRYDCYQVPIELPAVQNPLKVCREMSIPARVKPMNIGSDAHVLNHRGLPTVVLGMGFHFSHSLGEFIFTEELQQVFQMVHRLVSPLK